MTAAHSDLMALDREAFIAAHKHLDLTEDKDGWGRPKFAHDMVQALWDGWHKGRSALRLAQPDREALARSIEGIILRRVYEKRIEGYTLEMSLEQADAILSDGGSPDEQPSEPVTDQRSSADAKASSGDNVAAGVLPGPSDPSPGPDVREAFKSPIKCDACGEMYSDHAPEGDPVCECAARSVRALKEEMDSALTRSTPADLNPINHEQSK